MARTRAKRRARRSPAQAPRAPAPARERVASRVAPEPIAVDRWRWIGALAVGAIAFVVYVLTAGRDIFPGDGPEFATVALTGGVAHPPGYPLLSMSAALFGVLPVGPLPFRVNLVSVIAHAATVGVVFLISERLTRNVLASMAGALVLAFGALFWKWSLVIEAFPLNDLLVCLVVYFLVLWHERPMSRWPLFAAAVSFGLGIANHQTITLLIPGFALIVLDRRHELRGRALFFWQAVGIAVLAALIPYAYIPFAAARHEILNWGGVQSVGDLIRQFLRLDYGTGQLLPYAAYQGGTGIDRIADFGKHVNPVLAVLVLLGAVQAWRRLRWYFWAAVTMFFLSGPAFLTYANANVQDATARFVLQRFYLLPQVVVAPFAALGLVFAVEIARRRIETVPRWLPSAIAAVAIVAAAAELAVTYRIVDRSNDHVARDFAMDILATARENTILFASGDHVVLTLAYVQSVEHVRPDVTVVAIPLLPFDWYQRELKLRHPDINIPIARFDQPDGLKTFMQANLGRTFALTGEQGDQSIFPLYGTYGRGLLLPVIGPDAQLDLNAVRIDNEQLLASYRIPSLGSVDQESFERFIVDWYALIPWRLGYQYEQAKDYAEARTWFERSLAMQPSLPEAIDAMKRIQGK